jgi:hypothetical protein
MHFYDKNEVKTRNVRTLYIVEATERYIYLRAYTLIPAFKISPPKDIKKHQ